jgi:poly(beta-D-mannuronate) lyase
VKLQHFPQFLLGSLIAFVVSFADAAELRVCAEDALGLAIDSARPGDEIVMCSGEWRDLDIVFEANGTDGERITLRAETPGETVITGKSRIRMAGSYLTVSGLRFENGYPNNAAVQFRRSESAVCNNCRLTETSIIDYSPNQGTAEFDDYQFYVRVHGRNNRVDHNYFVGKHSLGQVLTVQVSADRPEAHRIDHNYFGHRIPQPSGNHGESVQVGGAVEEFYVSRTVIEDNYFHEANGDFEIVSIKATNVIVRRNTFDRSMGNLSLRVGNGSWVDGNTFLGRL